MNHAPLLLGAHTSTSGGLHLALQRGSDIGADAIQLFTRNQRQWKAKPLDALEIQLFQEARQACAIHTVVSHASYLLNLASPDPDQHAASVAALIDEYGRCCELGIELLVFHPGAHMKEGLERGTERIVAALNQVLEHAPTHDGPRLVLENVAGQGTTIGSTFAELARIISRVTAPRELLGICVDTAHAFAAGYDLSTPAGQELMFRELESTVGIESLCMLHINDSLVPLNSRKDRHAPLGHGMIGLQPLQMLVHDSRLSAIPAILETPTGMGGWAEEIRQLRSKPIIEWRMP